MMVTLLGRYFGFQARAQLHSNHQQLGKPLKDLVFVVLIEFLKCLWFFPSNTNVNKWFYLCLRIPNPAFTFHPSIYLLQFYFIFLPKQFSTWLNRKNSFKCQDPPGPGVLFLWPYKDSVLNMHKFQHLCTACLHMRTNAYA